MARRRPSLPTLGDEEALIVEAVPVHRRAGGTLGKDKGDTADSVVRVSAVLEDVHCQRANLQLLGRLLPVQLDRDGPSERHHERATAAVSFLWQGMRLCSLRLGSQAISVPARGRGR